MLISALWKLERTYICGAGIGWGASKLSQLICLHSKLLLAWMWTFFVNISSARFLAPDLETILKMLLLWRSLRFHVMSLIWCFNLSSWGMIILLLKLQNYEYFTKVFRFEIPVAFPTPNASSTFKLLPKLYTDAILRRY